MATTTLVAASQSLRDSVQDAARRINRIQAEAQGKCNATAISVCGICQDRLKPLPKIVNEIEEIERKISGLGDHKANMAGNAAELLRADQDIAKERARIEEGRNKVGKELETVSGLLDKADGILNQAK